MKIVLDASYLVTNRASGLRTYTWNLLHALRKPCRNDELVSFYHYFRQACPPPDIPGVKKCVLRFPRRPLEAAWRYLQAPAVDWWTGASDVYHSVHFLLPPVRRGASILTVHDVRDFRFPDLYPHLRELREVRAAMARRADRVVTISESTRDDAIAFMGLDPARVKVVYNGYDAGEGIDPSRAVEVRRSLELDRPYVLFLSSLDPRKGIADAVTAFGKARSHLRDFVLVVAGAVPTDWTRHCPAGATDHVRLTGMLSDAHLKAVLAGASALLFPSLHEGFGLPILEAFGCGTPVVAYDNSSIPEVAGDAGLLVPTKDTDALADALVSVITQADLRQALIMRGANRCQLFTWATAAEQLYAVYREAADEHPAG